MLRTKFSQPGPSFAEMQRGAERCMSPGVLGRGRPQHRQLAGRALGGGTTVLPLSLLEVCLLFFAPGQAAKQLLHFDHSYCQQPSFCVMVLQEL